MGEIIVYRFSHFDSLIKAHHTDSVTLFDAMLSIINDSDILKNDIAQFMIFSPELLLPVYDLSHEELFMLLWNAKYAEELFLPEYWAFVYYADAATRECYKCSSSAKLYYTSPLAESYDCNCMKRTYYYNDDVDELKRFVFQRNNYCIKCRRALYNIIDVEENDTFRCFC
nr:hypothetical protein Datr000105 [Darna trima granulovirus]